MRSLLLTILSCILLSNAASAQVKCYRFYHDSGSPDWRDTSCVACTSDPLVIADVNGQLSLAPAQRDKHINGKIAGGDANVNKNAGHIFLWHFKLNEWALAELSMEVCDGRPHSDVDMDTTYWFNSVTNFCPWSSTVAEEIDAVNITDTRGEYLNIATYPNPAKDYLQLISARKINGVMNIYNIAGQTLLTQKVNLLANTTFALDVSRIPDGMYMLTINAGESFLQQKLIIQH